MLVMSNRIDFQFIVHGGTELSLQVLEIVVILTISVVVVGAR